MFTTAIARIAATHKHTSGAAPAGLGRWELLLPAADQAGGRAESDWLYWEKHLFCFKYIFGSNNFVDMDGAWCMGVCAATAEYRELIRALKGLKGSL